MTKIYAKISGREAYLPEYILTNEELSQMLDTSDEWIIHHVGIKERRISKGDKFILSTFGGGFTWGAIYLKWAYN